MRPTPLPLEAPDPVETAAAARPRIAAVRRQLRRALGIVGAFLLAEAVFVAPVLLIVGAVVLVRAVA